ncbi:hypothetical protein [Dendrosporobacter sp. 1207_IL3150]|uniref:hypothetical protein n=1 Tax=Dendrosporobacter sp. 1207_IL3150 TaxID=3084054 RepID=UPI002FDADFDC
MEIKRGIYKGLSCYSIENSLISLLILPELGAKIASIFYKPQQFEVLFQPADGKYQLANYGANFAEYDTSGADEMFPTIDPCSYPTGDYTGITLPDHGELWSLPWEVTVDKDGLAARVEGRTLPYVFFRTISLNKSTIRMSYKVRNIGSAAIYGLWAFHGLVACDEFTRIMLPGVSEVINVHESTILGSVGTRHSFPVSMGINGIEAHLNRVGSRSLEKTKKFYAADKQAKGFAGITLNNNQLIYELLFPVDKVPYLGVWVNEGGFKGEYNCALEPATGYFDRLDTAYLLNSIDLLGPGAVKEWYLEIRLTSYEMNN